MPQQEISVVLKAVADKNSTSRAAKELQDQLKGKDARKGVGISDLEIRNWRKMSDEIDKLAKNLQQVNGILQKLAKGGTPGTPGGGGGAAGGGSTGGGGLSGFFGRIGDSNARWFMSSLMSMFMFSRLWGFVSQGRDLIQSEEDLASRLGTRIGGYGSDFRRTRLEFNAIADKYAYTNMETMRAADIYMSLAGTKNLQQSVSGILYASRGWGMDANNVAQFFGMYGKMGGTNVKQFAEELTAAINKSDMRGREDELLSAVKQLADSAYQTQLSVKDQQWNNIAGLMTYFASKDSSLKGDKGAQVIGGLDTMMRKGLNNSELLALMGYGSRYKGIQGLWELQKRLAKGITGDTQNLKDLIIGLNQWFADPTMAKEWLLQNTDLSPDAIETILRPDIQRDILSGKLSAGQLNKMLQQGGDLSKRVQDWMNSNAGARAKWQNSYKQDIAKSAADEIDQMITGVKKMIMNTISPDFAGGIVDVLLGGSAIHTGISVWNTLKNWFGGGKTPPKGGGGGKSFLDNPWEGLSDFAKGLGNELEGFIASFIPLPEQFLNQTINSSPSAMAHPQLKQTAMTYAYGWGSQNIVPAFGWGTQSFRTLEARRDDLLQKESNILRKREDLLNKESQMTNTESANNQNTLSLLEKVSYRLSDGMKDALQEVSYASTNAMTNVMQLAFSAFAGGGMGGLTTVSYGGGSGGSFRNMPLNDGFNMTPAEVNAWIDRYAPPGSVMRGQGAAFVEAARRTGLDVRYLVAHAALETGWGTSRIAKNKNNFFGIGAVDWNPYGGAKTFGRSPAEGIIAGAEWIAKNFVYRGQNTLYSMRHNGGRHEYASDPLWDEKIANLMSTAPNATLHVKVSGGIDGLTYTNNDMVARSIANAFQSVDLSRVFTQGQRGVWL